MIDEAELAQPPLKVQRILLDQERTLWIGSRYQCQVRLRVQKAIGGEAEIQAALIKDLERCERALDALAEEVARLPPAEHDDGGEQGRA